MSKPHDIFEILIRGVGVHELSKALPTAEIVELTVDGKPTLKATVYARRAPNRTTDIRGAIMRTVGELGGDSKVVVRREYREGI